MPLPRLPRARALRALAALVSTIALHGIAAPASAVAPTAASATKAPVSALQPNFLFSDNMVLQRDRPAPVWGNAPAGTNVRITFLGKSASTTATPNGKWTVNIGPFPAGGPHELVIEGASEKRVIKNVLVGDVWFCSGQSNMWWSVASSKDGTKEAAAANYPKIRLITIPQRSAASPVSSLEGVTWAECSPETVKQFSAVAYYFGRGLFQNNGVPVALIHSSWGGSAIQSWTSLSSLETNPDLVGITGSYYSIVRRFEKDFAAGVVDARDSYIDPGVQTAERGFESADYNDSSWKEWDQPGRFGEYGKPEYAQGSIWFRRMIEIPADWATKNLVLSLGEIGNYDIAYVNGIEVGRTDDAALTTDGAKRKNREYALPAGVVKAGKNSVAVRTFNARGAGGIYGYPDWQKRDIGIFEAGKKNELISLKGPWRFKVGHRLSPRGSTADPFSHKLPSSLFNGMVSPVLPFALRGVAWYQGESNTSNAWEYRAQFPLMIRSWREAWGEELPFLYVQLPNLGKNPSATPTEDSNYNESWNELRDAQWHGLDEPRTAMVTAIDLGDASIHPANKQDVGARLALAARAVALGEKTEYSGPLFAGVKIEGSKARVSFTHIGGGLVAKDSDTGALRRFAIAGADRNYVWADARIEGDNVIVWSDKVPAPVAVSYAWAMNPGDSNLYNKEGLPAAPFRSDDWPMRTLGKKSPY